MKRFKLALAAALLAAVASLPARAGIMEADAVPPPPCDPAAEVCPAPDPEPDTAAVVAAVAVAIITATP